MAPEMTNYINGAFTKTAKTIDSLNPATGKILGKVPDSGQQEVDAAVDAACTAFATWSKTTPEHRAEILVKIADTIQARIAEFARAESQDQGKPVSLALAMDIPRAIQNFRFFASSIQFQDEQSSCAGGFLNYVTREPVGPVALISPWNLPLYLLTWKIAPCLAYGCTAVCKPSEFTSLTAFMLCQVMHDAGLPAGVCNMVFGTGPSVGAHLVAHPSVPAISFTGGTVTGKYIYESAARLNKKVSLELGGKNANIIFQDADMDEVLPMTLRSSFLNQGEICLCGSRIFVHESIYQMFLDKFCKLANEMIVGDPLDEKTQVGALVSEQHLNKVLSYIQIAKEEGGNILTGGERLGGDLALGYFLRPTIVTGLHATESRLQKEEIFGPVVTVTPFSTDEEAVAYANSTEYGLSASVWTRDVGRAHKIAHALHVGTVWVNTWMKRDLNLPFGGIKGSGLGREGRHDSIDFYCEKKAITLKF